MDKEISHFWLGYFKDEEDFYSFVEEDENYYIDEETEDQYVSKFAESQGIKWFDDDFMEYGFEDENLGLYAKFSEYSYADEWLPVLESRLNEMNLDTPVNAIIFASRFAIPNPVSVDGEENKLYYMGEIEFNT
ncbi:immunity 22 family protein [Chryseobacterium arthrosphaerae]|uniref:immunity 22 family protein n=1 Tax=Chryseobacterium arthrosphaerae TaxID=651561 RepID=UPI00241CE40F|nr:immunity 22 family protein [Chryseobacterium arthrosphaerae]